MDGLKFLFMKQKFQNLGLILSRDAQKKLAGGLEEDPGEGGGYCALTTTCSLYVHALQRTLIGECYYQILGKCFCGASEGGQSYMTDPGSTSVCYHPF
jgi:hypothetical protein